MRPINPRPLALTLGLALGAAACASAPAGVRVNTTVAPEAQFGTYHTFAVLTPHMPGGPAAAAANPAAADDPMVDNSITNRGLRRSIDSAFAARGYTAAASPATADLSVAYYTAAKQALDVQNVDYGYGYAYRPLWWGAGRQQQVITPVDQGTVVIDVVDRRTNQLVWRGTGRTEVSTDQAKYTAQLGRAVSDVVQKLPQAGS